MFETFLIKPLYNGFIALIGVMPSGDVGLAIIILTIILRAIFFPVFSGSIRTQVLMRRISPELEAIREKYKRDPQESAKRSMALMREHKVRPFTTFMTALIQLPIFIALYIVFLREGLPEIASHLLYPFTPLPEALSTMFLGILDLTAKGSVALALLVGSSQWVQGRLTFARMPKRAVEGLSAERQAMLDAQDRVQRIMFGYFLPGLMTFITYTFPSAAGLYILTSSLFGIGQELYVRRKLEREGEIGELRGMKA